MARHEWFKPFFDKEYVGLLKAQMDNSRTKSQVDFIEKQLRLRPPARILDVACGFGRHSIELAERGYQVVGVDLSHAMLAEARQRGRNVKGVTFQHADMRRLQFDSEFDVVVNLFTSFGYFKHRENLLSLKNMAQALRPGGLIFVDVIDPKAVAKRYENQSDDHRGWWSVGTNFLVLERTTFDAKQTIIRSDWRILKRDGSTWKQFTKNMELRVYARQQWNEILSTCDLRCERFHSDYVLGQVVKKGIGPRLIVIARKPGQKRR